MEHIKLTNISFEYEKNAPVLSGITLAIEHGETLCIAGANGCGKSTLLHIIAGILKPASGTVTIGSGMDAAVSMRPAAPGGGVCVANSRSKIRRDADFAAGIVLQEVDHQLFMPTVWEDVAFGILKKGVSPAMAREAALAALRSVEAEHLAEKPPHKLSGGEKQRAALAGILITEPAALVLDEPSAALDPRARKNLIGLLRTLPRTKIIATHDLDLILDLADRVLFLDKGRIAALDAALPGRLADTTFLQSIGLELPLSLAR